MASLLVCEPCGKRFSGQAPYLDHIRSEKHLKKVKMVQMASRNGSNEMNCIIQISSKDDSTPVSSLPTIMYTEATFACGPCGKTFTGNIPYEDHMKSANHRRKVESLNFLKLMQEGNEVHNQPKCIEVPIEKLSCSACGIKFITLEATLEHYESDSHRSKKQFVLEKSGSSGSERSSPVDEVDMVECKSPTTYDEEDGCNNTTTSQHTQSLKLKIADVSTKVKKAVDLMIIEGDDDEAATKMMEAAIWGPRCN